jgi:hypothetical protein
MHGHMYIYTYVLKHMLTFSHRHIYTYTYTYIYTHIRTQSDKVPNAEVASSITITFDGRLFFFDERMIDFRGGIVTEILMDDVSQRN